MRLAVLAVIFLAGCAGRGQHVRAVTPEASRARHVQCIVDPPRGDDPAPAAGWIREFATPPDPCRAPADCSYARSL